jgi:hypothetical protein
MDNSGTDKVFAGSIPQFYETYLVPLLFEPYAADLVNRLASRSLGRVLEVAAGTGVVTRAYGVSLRERVGIVAADLNQPMLNRAAALGQRSWSGVRRTPCSCPSGRLVRRGRLSVRVMFFPDKTKALAEAHRAPPEVFCSTCGIDSRGQVRGHRDDGARIGLSRSPLPRADPMPPPAYDDRAGSRQRRFHDIPEIVTLAARKSARRAMRRSPMPGHRCRRDRGPRRVATREAPTSPQGHRPAPGVAHRRQDPGACAVAR